MGRFTGEILFAKVYLQVVISFAISIFFVQDVLSQSQEQKLDVSGTLRPVYSWVETRTREGDFSTEQTINARFHLTLGYQLTDQISFRSRLASRYSSSTNSMKFVIRDHTPGSGSYEAGVTTFDIFEIAWQVQPGTELRFGRFQGRFPLAGFIPKGMDRYYSANLSIGHTDGIWLRQNINSWLRGDFILSHNGKNGSTHAARRPLTFDQPESRVAGFINLAHRNTSGTWVQREISASLYPQSFERDNSLKNLWVITGRGMVRLPYTLANGEIWVGAEAGFMPIAPTPESAGVPVSNSLFESSSSSWQASLYFNDVFERHKFGFLYGQTEPEWVVSSSFRPNNTMAEFRYRFTFSSELNFEFRYRLRTDLYKRDSSAFTQRDNDVYARITWRF